MPRLSSKPHALVPLNDSLRLVMAPVQAATDSMVRCYSRVLLSQSAKVPLFVHGGRCFPTDGTHRVSLWPCRGPSLPAPILCRTFCVPGQSRLSPISNKSQEAHRAFLPANTCNRQPPEAQLLAKKDIPVYGPLAQTPVTWVDTPAALQALKATLDACAEFAIDLECHSYRSYQGFVCLMQVFFHPTCVCLCVFMYVCVMCFTCKRRTPCILMSFVIGVFFCGADHDARGGFFGGHAGASSATFVSQQRVYQPRHSQSVSRCRHGYCVAPARLWYLRGQHVRHGPGSNGMFGFSLLG